MKVERTYYFEIALSNYRDSSIDEVLRDKWGKGLDRTV